MNMNIFEQHQVFTYRLLKLAEALESGAYDQGQGRLRHGGNFCCLGVAEDLRIKEPGEEGFWLNDKLVIPTTREEGMDILTSRGSAFYGITQVGNIEGQKEHLIDLNDANVPFPEIAKVIRENIHNLL